MPDLPREIDISVPIADVVHRLYLQYGDRGPEDYLAGKTEFRDTVMDYLYCSSLEAEEVIDLLEVEGYLQFVPEPVPPEPGRGVWHVHRVPTSDE